MCRKLNCVLLLGAIFLLLVQCAYPQKVWEARIAESRGEPYSPYYLSTSEPVVDSPWTYFLYGTQCTYSGRSGYFLRDPLYKERKNIYDRSGRKKGYVQQDMLYKDTKNIYDRDGRRIGRVKQHPLYNDTKIIYDRNWRKKGTIRQDPLYNDRKIIYDRSGRRGGYLRKDPLYKGRANIYKR